jgi:hypothetical protein
MSKGFKRGSFLLFLGLFLSSAAYAGTATDTLGLATTWTKITSWMSDSSVTSIISFLMLIFAITLAVMKQYLYGVVILIMTVMLTNLATITAKFAGAMF